MTDFKAIRKRFENYILSRTRDYPSVLVCVIREDAQIRFELVDEVTRQYNGWSPLLDEASLDGGPGMMQLDHEILACLKELEVGG